MSFPGQQEPSPAFTAGQLNGPRQVQQPSVIAKEELYHSEDRCFCFKSVPRWVFSTVEEKRL